MLLDRIAADPLLEGLVRDLPLPGQAVAVSGLWGSAAPAVAACLASRTSRPLLYVTAHLEQADHARDDLEFFLGRGCDLFAAWETLPGEGAAAGEIEADRLRLCHQLAGGQPTGPPTVIVAPIQALMQPAPSRAALDDATRDVQVGEQQAPDGLAAWLVERGFERLELIEAPGDFARRGDILDVFVPGEERPWRIEFFGDVIEAVRAFDVSSQRSVSACDRITLRAPQTAGSARRDGGTSFLEYLPPDTVIVLDGPADVQDLGTTLLDRLGGNTALHSVGTVLAAADRFAQVHLLRFGGAIDASADAVTLAVRSLTRFEGRAAAAVQELLAIAASRHVVVCCANDGERRRLQELIDEVDPDHRTGVELVNGHVHRGFEWVGTECVVVGHHELFHRSQPLRRIRRAEAMRPIESWLDLESGDIIVHAEHGIARFVGTELLQKSGSTKREEFLKLEFAGRAGLHVPVSQIDLVQKYVGAGGKATLSTLGGTRWKKIKERVGESVEGFAEDLLRIQIQRMSNEGIAYPPDTIWQREFEDAFPYQETEDQVLVAAEIKRDLTVPRPMDRLLCGDVGYGKTELAVRAAFKVAEYGRQVAILVPTTVLAEQHFATFSDRMADYPFQVGCLSRFRSPRETRQMIEGLKKGQVDVVVGTHRLLSKDIQFADLGLLVIDEEQRFGVEHKERLKHLRATVEVLTMTATPIPRTLHLAMLGIRDISALSTPPIDRRSIATQVHPWNEGLIRDAIIRELNRDGQVFFVHNRVHNIQSVAAEIGRIVPDCRVLVGHGQMPDRALEEVMELFVRREADVLVSTTIIESGIDIPSANTIFVNEADRFGLADLHQLRGRVGRSSHRAYCFLLLPKNRPLTPKSTRRLKAIEEFSELGAGFRIAMRDLEIRGAGNILGPEQSGHIAAVGYDLYCEMLDQAVRRLRGEPLDEAPTVHLELGLEAYVPHSYVASERARLDVYRRTVKCRSVDELRQLEADLVDGFGKYPPAVERLLALAELRVLAHRWKIRSIQAAPPDIVFRVQDLAAVQPVFADARGTVRMPDPRTVHLRLRPGYFEPPTMIAYLRRLLGHSLKEEARV